MGKRRFTTEQIIGKLREAEVLQSQGEPVDRICKQLEINNQTYYRWRKQYGGIRIDQAKRLKSLEQENNRLKKIVADLTIDNSILKEVTRGEITKPDKKASGSSRNSQEAKCIREESLPGIGTTKINPAKEKES